MCSSAKKDILEIDKLLHDASKGKDIKNEVKDIYKGAFKRNVESLEERLLNLKKLVSGGVTAEGFDEEIKEIIEIANSPSIQNIASAFSDGQLSQLQDMLKKQVTIPLTSYIDERTTNMNNNIIKGIDGLMDKGDDLEVLIADGLKLVSSKILTELSSVVTRIDAIDAPRRLQ